MNNWKKITLCCIVSLVFQLSIYLYLDRILLAPTSAYQTSEAAESISTTGKVYYSADKSYMAVVENDRVKVYAMPGKKLVRTISVGTRKVSYFKWLEDCDIALMGVYDDEKGKGKVTLTQINPLHDDNDLSTAIDKLPVGSKITDVACSTATNVVYMQVEVAVNPVPLYRVYRTDANYDLHRVYFNTNRIGRISVLSDQDALIFEDREKNTVLVRHGNGSWRVISPPQRKYRLVGVDAKNNIYIVQLNAAGQGTTIFKGQLDTKFTLYEQLNSSIDLDHLKLTDILHSQI